MKMLRTRARTAAGLLAAISLFGLAACGGDDGGDDDVAAEKTSESVSSKASSAEETDGAKDSSASASSKETEDTEVEVEPIEVTLGKTAWYGDFAITLDKLSAAPGFFGTTLTIDVTYQNLTDESARPFEGTVVVDGEALPTLWDIPEIPGQGKARGTIETDVDTGDDAIDAKALDALLAKTSVVYGEASDNRSTIPLSKDGKVDSVEPKTLSAKGTLTQAQLIVEVLSGRLAPSYEVGDKGKTELDLRIKISCAADCPASGFNVDTSMFSVKGPDGTSVTADGRSDYCCDAIYPGDVSDNARNVLTFVVPNPGTGAYTLTFNNPSLTSAGTAPATFAFTA